MVDPAFGRFAFYQEEVDELLRLARALFAELKATGRPQVTGEWLMGEPRALVGEKGTRFEVEEVLGAAKYLGLVRVGSDESGSIEIL